jgi:hypothetical protein
MAKKEELKDEEPMQLGAEFGIKVIIFAAFLVAIVVGVPYFLMKY